MEKCESQRIPKDGSSVVLLTDKESETSKSLNGDLFAELNPHESAIQKIQKRKEKAWVLVGGDSVATYYSACNLAENMGLRFNLHNDVIPVDKLAK